MYYYKLTLKNGIEYLIKDKENNIRKFIESIAANNKWRDFLLASENTYTYEFGRKEVNTNTIMILTNEIIAVEYYSIWG